jgi:hypothetical protein
MELQGQLPADFAEEMVGHILSTCFSFYKRAPLLVLFLILLPTSSSVFHPKLEA